MSHHLNTIAGGYKGGSPKVRSENTRPPFVDNNIKTIDKEKLVEQIKMWHADKNLSTEDINYIINQLQTIV